MRYRGGYCCLYSTQCSSQIPCPLPLFTIPLSPLSLFEPFKSLIIIRMLERLWHPHNPPQSKPFNYYKSFFIGAVTSTLYSRVHLLYSHDFGKVLTVKNFENFLAQSDFSLNRTAYTMLSGGVRFAFYDIFKRFFREGLGEKWGERMRWVTYGLSAAAAEFLSVTISLPFDNVKILQEKILTLKEIEVLRNATRESQIRGLFLDETINTQKNYYKGYKQALMRNLPCTAITFTTFQLASEIWYDYIVRTPKQQFNGFSQSLFSFICGSIAGSAFYLGTRVFSNLEIPTIKTTPIRALTFYSITIGTQFSVYNLAKIMLKGETLGSGTNSQLH